jgi:uncharacterized protein
VLAIDPGFRTGCKVVALDKQGNLLHHTVIYPHAPQNDREGAAAVVASLVKRFAVEAFAVGNGTAGRETEAFVRSLGLAPEVFVVNEDGAIHDGLGGVLRKGVGYGILRFSTAVDGDVVFSRPCIAVP